ncbi:uncharacterized protein LOC123395467 isoform X1 [Hordeum vulgare subsp. vulgare]|uniref:uncharacterized protein LOC123395467 isoform X1 n=1 Tax=Hordeum vulgare subsp. vulgare TaxID=112509 RepID=UPI001D1A472B|nr:uncharacterized protein LOC123395467 isoform X1 [Hordeum vulgare subsp. vulgare]
MTRKKEEEEEKKKKKKKKKQQQHKEEDAQVTSDKITDKMETKEEQEEEEEDAQVTSAKITEKMETKEEQEEEEARRQQAARKMMLAHDFLHLSSNILARPCCYRNELAMMITEEDEQEDERLREAKRHAEMEEREAEMEAERKAERERERLRERSKQRKANREAKRKQMLHKERIVEEEQCIVEHKEPIVEEEHADEQEAKPPKEQLKEWMDNHLGFFAGYRTDWEYSSGSKPGQCGEFEDKTTLSPMQFTHCIPGIIPPRAAVIESTLQIYSFKITGLSDDLKWPLNVYGVIAARDTVDHNRNLLFSRSSIMRQVLTSENDCSLCLTGPSRAILAMDPVDFEVELRVHDGCDPRGDGLNDRELIYVSSRYEVAPSGELPCLTFHSPLCTAKLSLERLPSTIQATILSVRVVGGRSPFKSGVQVSCWSSSADGSPAMHEVVLLDSLERIPQEYEELDLDGYLPLSRKVVSVQCGGGLDVVVKPYGGSGSTSSHIYFPSEYCNISQRTCWVCGSQVDITVAWSRLVRDKMDLLIDGYITQA